MAKGLLYYIHQHIVHWYELKYAQTVLLFQQLKEVFKVTLCCLSSRRMDRSLEDVISERQVP